MPECFFDSRVARCTYACDFQSLEDRNARGDQGAQGACKSAPPAIFRMWDAQHRQRSAESNRSCTASPGVLYQTRSPMTDAPRASTISKPKMLPTKLLMAMTIRVGKGRFTPKPKNNVAVSTALP